MILNNIKRKLMDNKFASEEEVRLDEGGLG